MGELRISFQEILQENVSLKNYLLKERASVFVDKMQGTGGEGKAR